MCVVSVDVYHRTIGVCGVCVCVCVCVCGWVGDINLLTFSSLTDSCMSASARAANPFLSSTFEKSDDCVCMYRVRVCVYTYYVPDCMGVCEVILENGEKSTYTRSNCCTLDSSTHPIVTLRSSVSVCVCACDRCVRCVRT